jgi:cytochrome c553
MTMIVPLLIGSVLPAAAQQGPPGEDMLARCESCHAPGARGRTSATPRLNGQSYDYLVGRLSGMTSGLNQSPHSLQAMWSNAHQLDDAARRRIARHYADLPADKATPGPQAALGRQLYEDGLPSEGVTPCQSCHGPSGEGSDAGPRLAGQRRDYLTEQLWAFNLVARVHGPMNHTAMQLMPGKIDALASFLGGE